MAKEANEMTIWQHLDELRKRLLFSLLGSLWLQ